MSFAPFACPSPTPLRVAIAIAFCCMSATAADLSTAAAEQKAFLSKWCQSCHSDKAPAGGFRLSKLASPPGAGANAEAWEHAAVRVRNMEMPPRNAPSPPLAAREQFTKWIDESLRTDACAVGPKPGFAWTRRLNRDEYASTIQDLLNVNIDVGQTLPVEGAGGEGFDNAAETLTVSPIHAEKYMESAKAAFDFVATDARAREGILIATPGKGLSEKDAANQNILAFLRRAFRRPVDASATAPYLDLFQVARQKGEPFDRALFFSLRAVLMSPQFLFRVEPTNSTGELQRVDDYVLASRLSYFIWGTMPDELLFDIAESGKLHQPEVLKGQIGRMLRSPRSIEFSRRFVEQWLRTRDLGRDKAPDAKLFPVWAASEETRSDIGYQPVLFLRELLVKDLSLLNLLDSKFTVMNSTLAKLYKVPVKWRQGQDRALYRVELPEGSDRGGLLGMPAVLTLSSYPNRTSPVLRGAWVLETLLGTPPPPPPPGVPPLDKEHASTAATVRERLMQHRADPNCASCHDRMDPIGFALENYDAMGFWRTEDAGKPVDTAGELPDGSKFKGPNELKSVLLNKKDLFLRTLTSKMLGYALGRGLTRHDSCTVDAIVAQVKARDYSAQSLVEGIVASVPFQFQGEGRKISK